MKRITESLLVLTLLLILGVTACEYEEIPDGTDSDSTKTNDYPIILVHGFNGWGRNEWIFKNTKGEKVPLLHMGGFTDVEEELKAKGYEVYTPDLGPFSSNWDRACELYAQIMNNPTVDYGKAHAEKYGHKQIVPNKQYDDPDKEENRYTMKLSRPWSKQNKVHLIAHSMGSSTCRLLIHLLEHGDPEEMALTQVDSSYKISPLFDTKQDTKGMVQSLVSLAGIVNGTTLADSVKRYGDFLVGAMNFSHWVYEDPELAGLVNAGLEGAGLKATDVPKMTAQKLVILVLAEMSYMFGTHFINDTGISFYDFNLEQWEIAPLTDEKGVPMESMDHYRKRVFQADLPIWTSDDTCLKDLTAEGMIDFNSRVIDEPSVYYFSYTTKQTKKINWTWYNIWYLPWLKFDSYCKANSDMSPLMGVFAYLMGTYGFKLDFKQMSPADDKYVATYGRTVGKMTRFEEHWFPNDGVVNTYQAKYPMINSSNKCRKLDRPLLGEHSPQTFSFEHDEEIDDSNSEQRFDYCDESAEELKTGLWYHLGQIDSDHWDVIGLGMQKKLASLWPWSYVYGPYYADGTTEHPKSEALIDFYRSMAEFLTHLPDAQ